MNEVELVHFYDVAGDWVVNNAGYDRLSAFGFESTLVAVELIAMTACIVFIFSCKYLVISARTCLVINNNVAIFCFPNEINITTNYMTILIQMTEGLLMVTLDCFAIAGLQSFNKIFP